MFLKIIVVLSALLSANLHADKLILGGVSKHFITGEHDCEFNENHPALGYEGKGWETGMYYNSIENISLFVTKIERPWKITKSISAGYRVGIASGYKGKTECESDEPPRIVQQIIEGDNGEPVTLFSVREPEPLEDEFKGYKGFYPQAHFIISHQSKYITTDLGIGLVSTLNFKLNL